MRLYAILAALMWVLSAPVCADEPPDLDAYAKYGSPGPAHAWFQAIEGEWTATTSTWMQPDAPPTVSSGTCSNKLILGGRFLEERFQSSLAGRPFEGRGLYGHDNYRQVYTCAWLDSMSTRVLLSDGKADGNVLTLVGPFEDPVRKRKSELRMVLAIVDADHYTFEMYDQGENKKWVRVMRTEFTRKR